jgi:uncharacterized protein involved in exopolysaccharide biosynthesis
MNENELAQHDEISLFDLWRKLQNGWRNVAGGMAVGVLGAGLAIALIPPKYEAIAIVQVGQVGQVSQGGQGGLVTSQPVEPPSQTIERMKTSAFQLGVAEKLGSQPWIDSLRTSANATASYLSLQIVKSTLAGTSPLIELRAKGDSAENAKNVATVAVSELADRQAEIAKPMIDKMRLDLMIAKEKLASAEKELGGINKLVANAGFKDDRFTQLSLMTTLRVQKESELFSQRQMIMALETALTAPATQPAKTIEAVFVTDKPLSPKKSLLLALGLIGGLLGGVITTFVKDAWGRAKEARLLDAVS